MMMTDGCVWGNDNKLCVRDSNLLIYWPARHHVGERRKTLSNATSDKDIRNREGRGRCLNWIVITLFIPHNRISLDEITSEKKDRRGIPVPLNLFFLNQEQENHIK